MKHEERMAQKKNHDRIMDIKRRLDLGKETTFQERQALYIYNKRKTKKS